jgi:hypothetical protein
MAKQSLSGGADRPRNHRPLANALRICDQPVDVVGRFDGLIGDVKNSCHALNFGGRTDDAKENNVDIRQTGSC